MQVRYRRSVEPTDLYMYSLIYMFCIYIYWHTSLRRKYFRSGTLRVEFEPDFGLYMEIYPIFACAFHTLSPRVVCQFDGSHVIIMIDVLRVYIETSWSDLCTEVPLFASNCNATCCSCCAVERSIWRCFKEYSFYIWIRKIYDIIKLIKEISWNILGTLRAVDC